MGRANLINHFKFWDITFMLSTTRTGSLYSVQCTHLTTR